LRRLRQVLFFHAEVNFQGCPLEAWVKNGRSLCGPVLKM